MGERSDEEMKTKMIGLLIAMLFALSAMAAAAVPTAKAHTESKPFKTDLIAGQSIDVGDVLVWNDEDYLYVKYLTDGWYISEVHLEVAEQLSGIPQAKGNPIPGKFTYGEQGLWETEYEFPPIPLTWPKCTKLHIAAHAKVWDASSLMTDIYESADGSAQVYGPVSSYLPLGDVGWGTPIPAVATWKHPSWPLILGSSAVWISNSYSIENARPDSWRKFTITINVPGVPTSGSVVTATADNAEEVYLNGALIGSDGTVNVPFDASGGDPHEWNTIKDYPFTPVQGTNKLEFIVHNYAYPTDDPEVNPTGLIYKATVSYYARCETAWGDGSKFPGKNWATYFIYTVQPCLIGDWTLDFLLSGDGHWVHDMTITSQMADGTLSGYGGYPSTGPPYTHPWTLTGKVSDNTVTFTIVYVSPAPNPGYTVYATGTIAADGSMSGTATSSTGQSFTWTATRTLANSQHHR